MNKKAQVEILGLIIIVILVVVAMIFVLQFTVLREPETVKEYSDTEIANNMLTSLLQTTTGCHGLTVTDLLKDCAGTGWPGEIQCNSTMRSCDYLNYTIDYLFSNTLDLWGRSYEFRAVLPILESQGRNPVVFSRLSGVLLGGFNPALPHPISVEGSPMMIYLDVYD
jgi:hypothetical protein